MFGHGIHSHVSHLKKLNSCTLDNGKATKGNITFAATECNPSASEVAVIGENSGNLFWKCSRNSLHSKQDVHAVIYDPGDLRDIYHTKPENLDLFVPEDVDVYIRLNDSHEV